MQIRLGVGVGLVLVAAVGCGDSAGGAGSSAPSAKPAVTSSAKPTASASATATASAAATTSASAAAATAFKAPPGEVVALDKLQAIKLPVPAEAKTAKWQEEPAPVSGPGGRISNLKDGQKVVYSVIIMDCRLPIVAEHAKDTASPPGDDSPCFKPGTDKVKDFPEDKSSELRRRLRVGNMAVAVGVGPDFDKKLKAADLDKLVESIDLAAISKL